jgi:uncharacterized protein YecT (DUF1311 family)
MNSIINRLSIVFLLVAPGWFLNNGALAQSNKLVSQSFDCRKAKTTPELTYCSRLDYETADKRLNRVYQRVVSNVRGERKNFLVNAQLAWIKFRDNNCNFETYLSRGGREYNIYRNICLQELTERRTKDLEKNILNGNANNNGNRNITTLPDGNYRFVTADFPPPPAITSDEELVKAGGFLYLFRKRGDRVVGILGQIDSKNVICVSGKVEGNKVIGEATQINESLFNSARVIGTNDTFAKWDSGGYLDVRRGKKQGNKIQYSNAILNLNSFNRINAGSRVPPDSCK